MASTKIASDGCTTHRETCHFGRDHRWCIGFYDAAGTWHSAMICPGCSGVCDAELREDSEVCSCGAASSHSTIRSPFNA